MLLLTCTPGFPMCTDVHLKLFCVHKIFCAKNYNYEDLHIFVEVRKILLMLQNFKVPEICYPNLKT